MACLIPAAVADSSPPPFYDPHTIRPDVAPCIHPCHVGWSCVSGRFDRLAGIYCRQAMKNRPHRRTCLFPSCLSARPTMRRLRPRLPFPCFPRVFLPAGLIQLSVPLSVTARYLRPASSMGETCRQNGSSLISADMRPCPAVRQASVRFACGCPPSHRLVSDTRRQARPCRRLGNDGIGRNPNRS